MHAPVHSAPLRDQPWQQHSAAVARAAAEEEPVLHTVLEPGDALYLPRGYLHAAASLGATTAHLTVGVHTVIRFALVDALLEGLRGLAAQRPELRAALPMGLDVADPDQLAAHLRTVAGQLATAVHEVPTEQVARRVRQQVWAGGRPEPLGPIAQASFAGQLAPHQSVRCRGNLRFVLCTRQDCLVLELPDRSLTLPVAHRAAVQVLLGGAEVVVGELPGLDDADRLVLVRRLLREGVLMPVPAP